MRNNKINKIVIPVLGIAIVMVIPLVVKDFYIIHILINILFYVVLTVSMRFILLTGQMNFAHGSFAGLGAYCAAILSTRLGIGFWEDVLLAGIVAAICGFIIGIPTLRIKGAYFAMATFALSEVIKLVEVTWEKLFGGPAGIHNIPRPASIPLGFTTIEFTGKVPFYYVILLIALISVFVMYRLEKRTRLGLVFKAIDQADVLAESVGINILRYKLVAITIGCFFAGIAGSFYAHYNSYISPNDFAMFGLTLWIVLYAVVGGLGSWVGPVIGTAVLIITGELLRSFREIVPLFYGIVVVIIMVFLPRGIIEIPQRIRGLFKSEKGEVNQNGLFKT